MISGNLYYGYVDTNGVAKVEISSKDLLRIDNATQTDCGMMSSEDKAKLDNINITYKSGEEKICNRLGFDFSDFSGSSLYDLNSVVNLSHTSCESKLSWYNMYAKNAATPEEYPDFMYIVDGANTFIFVKTYITSSKIIYFNQYRSIT